MQRRQVAMRLVRSKGRGEGEALVAVDADTHET
jgi:hypothetical protein